MWNYTLSCDKLTLGAQKIPQPQPELIVAGPSNVLLTTTSGASTTRDVEPRLFHLEGRTSLSPAALPNLAFGFGIATLCYAVEWQQLGNMPWAAILSDGLKEGQQEASKLRSKKAPKPNK